jgi:hypothetical protein
MPGPARVLSCPLHGYDCDLRGDDQRCALCGAFNAWPFPTHYACIQRARQLAVRWRWAMPDDREVWPDV